MLCVLLLCCQPLQDQANQNKNWAGKRVYPAHGGTINMILPTGKEVEWPFIVSTALGSKGEFVELRVKKSIGLVRMLEVVHEDNALEYYRMKIEDEPNRLFWKQMHAMALVEQNADDALPFLDSYVLLNPSCVTLSLRAQYHQQRNNIESALSDLNDALLTAPGFMKRLEQHSVDHSEDVQKQWFSRVYLQRSILHAKKKQIDQAKADIQLCLKLTPDASRAYAILSDLAFDEKRYDEALTHIDRAIQLDDEYTFHFYRRTVILLAQNKLQAAQEELPNFMNRNDLDSFDLAASAWLLATHPLDGIRNGRISLELAQRAATMKPDKTGHTHAVLAAALAETGDYLQAIAQLQEAMKSPIFLKQHQAIAQHQLALYRKNQPYRWRTMSYQGQGLPGWK